MPVYLRTFYLKRLTTFYKKESEEMQKQMNKFKKSIKLLGYVLSGISSVLLFLIVSTYWFANYDLNDIGLGLLMLILSSLVISVKGDCYYDS